MPKPASERCSPVFSGLLGQIMHKGSKPALQPFCQGTQHLAQADGGL